MFNTIIGHDKIKKQLENAITNNNILHSYLFIGEEGIGKKLMAKELAKTILCTSSNDKPCDICKSCIEFNSNNNVNFQVIDTEGSSIKIDQIRNMQSKIAEKPVNSDHKVYIINDSELMTVEAQNCLLKTLEEPPQYITIILITSNENKILNTIKSRCTKIYFNLLSEDEIKTILNGLNIDNITNSYLQACGGSIKKAILLKEKSEEYEQIDKIFDIIDKDNIVKFINNANVIYENKDDIYNMLDYINIILNNKAKEGINQMAYANCIFIVEEVKKRLRANGNFDMCIDYLLMNMWKEINSERNSRN